MGTCFTNVKIIKDSKIRAFQYKQIFNLTPSKLYLYRIRKSESYLCNNCNGVNNITRYFYGSEENTRLWSTFQRWWNVMMDETVIINKELVMIGHNDNKKGQ